MVTDPIAYWRLNNRGVTALDSSPHGFNGTISPSVVRGAPGPVPGGDVALEFPGADAYVQVPGVSASLIGSEFGFSGWVKTTQDTDEWLIACDTSLQVFANTGSIQVTDGAVWVFTPNGLVDDGQWHHVAVSWTSGGSTLIYVDNVQQASGTGQNLAMTTDGVFLAAWGVGGGPADLFLAKVAMYGHTLSPADVTALFNGAEPIAPPPAPIGGIQLLDPSTFQPRPYPLGTGRFAGVGWGPGQKIQIQKTDGFDSSPDLTTTDQQRMGSHGMWAGRDLAQGQTRTVTFVVLGDDSEDLRRHLAMIEWAWQVADPDDPDPVDQELWMYDSSRFSMSRVRRIAIDGELGGRGRTGTVTVQWFAADPFWYGQREVRSFEVRTASGGIGYPLTFPMTYGSITGGGAQVFNRGGRRVPVVITIPGPTINPSIGNATTGQEIRLNIELTPTDQLTLDSDLRTVLLNGTVNRNDRIASGRSQWWGLQRGINQLYYRSYSQESGERASVEWSPAWQ